MTMPDGQATMGSACTFAGSSTGHADGMRTAGERWAKGMRNGRRSMPWAGDGAPRPETADNLPLPHCWAIAGGARSRRWASAPYLAPRRPRWRYPRLDGPWAWGWIRAENGGIAWSSGQMGCRYPYHRNSDSSIAAGPYCRWQIGRYACKALPHNALSLFVHFP